MCWLIPNGEQGSSISRILSDARREAGTRQSFLCCDLPVSFLVREKSGPLFFLAEDETYAVLHRAGFVGSRPLPGGTAVSYTVVSPISRSAEADRDVCFL